MTLIVFTLCATRVLSLIMPATTPLVTATNPFASTTRLLLEDATWFMDKYTYNPLTTCAFGDTVP